MNNNEYRDKGRFIWKNYVPKSGQSNYVQGELLRTIEKLRDEAQRNGNVNWDEGYEILSNYLLSTIEKSNILNNSDSDRGQTLNIHLKYAIITENKTYKN